ncbi:hypothetical protein HUK76_09855 [Citrobacter portucalensis]|uniref:hypothetical protein n=1 Tax=Citrobacter portucalensis TaxID=1639133 RepID=UPI0015804799|nr:hypothetical protein [Citrobacter portucalensis]NUH52705.1 hypothetical protein [Citrobacter portucalensis]NUH53999.1 hypothetical protein [Citrobacter portucalensis]
MDRNTPYRDGELNPVPVAAATEIFGGHMVSVNAAGYAVPASATAAQITLGVSDGWVDNGTGSDGDVTVLVRRGKAFLMANSTAEPVTQTQVGKECYVEDSVTVAKTDNGSTRPVAGKVIGIGDGGVWVYFS